MEQECKDRETLAEVDDINKIHVRHFGFSYHTSPSETHSITFC